ncbi:MAG: glutamyl-tRNA reductase [Parachlamydiaceae bacterium]|nr:glutamyl-tRNA reductase [Parachlamydiaceae bacterium]
MRVGVLGINHKLADLNLRELLAKACRRRFSPEMSIHSNHNFVLLSTCNRTEVYFCSEELTDTHSYLLNILRQDVQDISQDFDQKLYSYFGYDCFLHLCRVTAGLDSAIVAETEIQGQVKAAYERTLEFCRLPHELHYLFQKSLRIAKKIRLILPLKPGLPDTEHAILQTAQHLFENYQKTKVLFIGASEINQKILSFLKTKHMASLTLCNRSKDRGRKMAGFYDIPYIGWEEVDLWHAYDWIIVGTKSTEHLISLNQLPGYLNGPKLIIDLSVPRNVDPILSRHPDITLLNIDQINRRLKIRRKNMHLSLHAAEELVVEATSQQVDLFQEKERSRLRILAVGA